jgi:RecA-family ATPase
MNGFNNIPSNTLLKLQVKNIDLEGLIPAFDTQNFSIKPDDILIEVKDKLKVASEAIGLFIVKTASRWIEQAKIRPIPNMLFSEFWYQGELVILFADTGIGKSILAVQIGNSISKGEQIKEFILESPKQLILYFDFELSDKQFENRYSENYDNHYNFDDNFIRVEINPDADIPENFVYDDFLINSIEHSIIETGVKVVFIDNITYLKNENEKAKDALPLMKRLMSLKKKYGLSIMVLAHTPKRDLSRPITMNDLAGSKMLMNFIDSAFTIGESTLDKNIRYLKQIKVRHTEFIYDAENVCICQIDKSTNFLQFEFRGFGKEREHLKNPSDKDRQNLIEQVIELHKQGRSLRDIGNELGITHMKASRILKENNKS